jgi:hypothetical protein
LRPESIAFTVINSDSVTFIELGVVLLATDVALFHQASLPLLSLRVVPRSARMDLEASV